MTDFNGFPKTITYFFKDLYLMRSHGRHLRSDPTEAIPSSSHSQPVFVQAGKQLTFAKLKFG
jgi:hypothetical protein